MNESTKKYLYIVGTPLILSALFVSAWFGYQAWQGAQDPQPVAQFSFTVIPEKQPSLEREVVTPEGFPGDAATIARNRITELREAITKDPASYTSWLDLAIMYKTLNDYEGAKEVWEYLTAAAPMEPVPFQNLGSLYDLYLKDYPKAEENYLKAIKNASEQTYSYMGLHELYRYSYKTNTDAAAEILKKGIATVGSPQSFDLRVTLAGYYKEKGDIKNALVYYKEARTQAQDLKNAALVEQMDREIYALEQQQ